MEHTNPSLNTSTPGTAESLGPAGDTAQQTPARLSAFPSAGQMCHWRWPTGLEKLASTLEQEALPGLFHGECCDELAQDVLASWCPVAPGDTVCAEHEDGQLYSFVLHGAAGLVENGEFKVALYGARLRKNGLVGRELVEVRLSRKKTPARMAYRDGLGQWKAFKPCMHPRPSLETSMKKVIAWWKAGSRKTAEPRLHADLCTVDLQS